MLIFMIRLDGWEKKTYANLSNYLVNAFNYNSFYSMFINDDWQDKTISPASYPLRIALSCEKL